MIFSLSGLRSTNILRINSLACNASFFGPVSVLVREEGEEKSTKVDISTEKREIETTVGIDFSGSSKLLLT